MGPVSAIQIGGATVQDLYPLFKYVVLLYGTCIRYSNRRCYSTGPVSANQIGGATVQDLYPLFK